MKNTNHLISMFYRAFRDLRRLQSLLAKNSPRQEVDSNNNTQHHTKAECVDILITDPTNHLTFITYRDQRCFSSHPLHELFSHILVSLIKNRLCSEWIEHAPPESVLRVLICLRLLIRDPHYQKILHELQGISLLARYMESVTALYMSCGEQAFATQKLVTMTYIFQKLSATQDQRVWVIESGAHRVSDKLLYIQGQFHLLQDFLLCSIEFKEEIGKLLIVESLLVILQEYDLLSKSFVLRLKTVTVPKNKAQNHSHSDRQYITDRSSIEALSSANATGRIQREHMREELSPQEVVDNTIALQSACCTALTEMSLDDTSAHHIVQENGIYIIAKLIIPCDSGQTITSLQCYAFRALRFLFSVERNRHLFKRLFPTDLFELFIDVGHYVRDLAAYEGLQTKKEELDNLRGGIETVDQNRPPLRVISGYSVLDHLGTGAFGSVFKVQKQSGQNILALKEVNLHNPAFGKDKKSRDSNVEKIISELTIIKEQMTHPNIVKYYRTFLEGDKLYIVMELIEGVPLAEHFNSLKEKQQQFTEERLWNIFIQMSLALRYLHKEKRIVHRDLTPNNIMLGEKDKVTITDFGLAKQKEENSKLTSVVGTILYSCPEIVKNEPYGEKADIWALGCILYQMATLQPPFYSSNMLSLASKIVEADYEPIEEGTFSERVIDMIKWCLNPDPDLRPDIIAVSSRISDLMMKLMDGLYTSQNSLERKAERDRKRAQKFFLERDKIRVTCSYSNMSQTHERLNCAVALINKYIISLQRFKMVLHILQETPTMETEYAPSCSSTACSSNHSREQRLAQALISQFVGFALTSVSAGICVSQKKLRQIDDPIQRLLVQLHKIIFITQLPPAPHHHIKRRLVERFKKSLFQFGSDPYNLKVELSKAIIEELLNENSYYEPTNSR
uniref:NIMA-related kinase 10 n=1 Tax=Neolamprologus brichardi TaxID=32507 RepID=A0A3Q4HJ00_NEOBR